MRQLINIFIPAINRKDLVLETLSSLPLLLDRADNLVLKVTVLGNSDDGTGESVEAIYGNSVRYIGEDDLGLYDALGKHLSNINDGYVTWLGAGDKWAKDAMLTISKTVKMDKKWFMGRPIIFDSHGQISQIFPIRQYSPRLIIEGWHDGYLPLIQQESTIWHASLHKNVNWDRFRSFQLAGDYYLWTCFAQSENLYSCDGHIGGYRLHDNSLSGLFFDEY
jgi:glycosyltransferase involved in cell wall biosynthesis